MIVNKIVVCEQQLGTRSYTLRNVLKYFIFDSEDENRERRPKGKEDDVM